MWKRYPILLHTTFGTPPAPLPCHRYPGKAILVSTNRSAGWKEHIPRSGAVNIDYVEKIRSRLSECNRGCPAGCRILSWIIIKRRAGEYHPTRRIHQKNHEAQML
jgi:hypothetical protein